MRPRKVHTVHVEVLERQHRLKDRQLSKNRPISDDTEKWCRSPLKSSITFRNGGRILCGVQILKNGFLHGKLCTFGRANSCTWACIKYIRVVLGASVCERNAKKCQKIELYHVEPHGYDMGLLDQNHYYVCRNTPQTHLYATWHGFEQICTVKPCLGVC